MHGLTAFGIDAEAAAAAEDADTGVTYVPPPGYNQQGNPITPDTIAQVQARNQIDANDIPIPLGRGKGFLQPQTASIPGAGIPAPSKTSEGYIVGGAALLAVGLVLFLALEK